MGDSVGVGAADPEVEEEAVTHAAPDALGDAVVLALELSV